jgi:hypothetical protein
MIQPWLNDHCVKRRKTAAAASEMRSVPRSEKRRPESGASRPRPMISRRLTHPGTAFSGCPPITVEMAFAWISGPGIRSFPYDTGCWSWKVDAQGPTMTILSLK